MKFSSGERKLMIAALDKASATAPTVVQRWEYQNLMKKIERIERSAS